MKIISNILLILNPVCGFLIFASIFDGFWHHTYWWLIIPVLVLIVVYNIKLHCYAYRAEHAKYEEWEKEFSKTHEYLGEEWYYGSSIWRNKLTGKIIES